MVLVNGFDAWVETPDGTVRDLVAALRAGRDSSRRRRRGSNRFEYEPWPRWRCGSTDDLVIEQEIFVPHGESAVFARRGNSSSETARSPVTLKVRPFLSGRDFHSMHHENGSFRFEPSETANA